jgi:nucleotide-binding universal stress UspA family protein
MKILIGVDDSACSQAAIDMVGKFTWPPGTKVLVVSAIRPVVMAYAEMYIPVTPASEQILEDQTKAQEELVARAERKLRDARLATEARVLRGDPREAIVDAAKAESVDLVVVGSHGRSGVTKLLMGSVASHVVTHAPCSVLVVKQKT